ncbi:hypothetical protein PV325_009609 [Microctonus aethiopoides]|nr:hypothetical protein PV325_009609 [Microctonus aethiopoides]
MSSQSEDANCNKTVALTNTSKCNSFIYDVTLDLSYQADAKWENVQHFWRTILTTITCQIGHKYKNWKKCSCVIAQHLMQNFVKLNLSSTEWKGTISVAGQYVDEESVDGYSEIIHDWFCYGGFITIPKNPNDQQKSASVCLEYTIRFLLNPALPSAQIIYSAKGYEKMLCNYWTADTIRQYENIMNTEVDYKNEYNHFKIWDAAFNAYKPSPSLQSIPYESAFWKSL